MESRIRKTMPIHNTRLMHCKNSLKLLYSPVPVDGEVRGGVWQGLQVGGGAPPVLPGVQPGHAHSNLTQGSCHKGGIFRFFLFIYDIQHCFICRPSDSTVSIDAGIEPRTVATTAHRKKRFTSFPSPAGCH